MACGGSCVFCGEISIEDIKQARNSAGDRFANRLDALGLAGRPLAKLDPTRHRAFLEAHIEQGPRLIDAGLNVGAVSGIVGLRRRRVPFHGHADHAGTTQMAMRRDAPPTPFFSRSAPTAAARSNRNWEPPPCKCSA